MLKLLIRPCQHMLLHLTLAAGQRPAVGPHRVPSPAAQLVMVSTIHMNRSVLMGGAPLQPGSDAAACLALSVPVKVHPKPSQLQTLDTSPRSTTSFPPPPLPFTLFPGTWPCTWAPTPPPLPSPVTATQCSGGSTRSSASSHERLQRGCFAAALQRIVHLLLDLLSD